MSSHTTQVSLQATLMNIITFEEEEQHYQRILNNMMKCQERSENDASFLELYVCQEITALMHELNKVLPESPLFTEIWTLVRNSIILLQSCQTRDGETDPAEFSKLSFPEQTRIQEIMVSYLS
ncbi:MAG: hypothetical protein ACTSWW_00740 [Promethearchaeota archaeon]